MISSTKTIVTIIMIFFSFQELTAQNDFSLWQSIDKNDRFNDVNTPFLDGLTMWLLRQNLTTNGLQVQVKSEIPVDKGLNNPAANRYFEVFIPLLNSNKLGSFVGAAQNKAVIQSDDESFTKNLQYNYYIFVLQYHYNNWKFGLSGEYYYSSAGFIDNSRTGDEWMPLVTAAYAFSEKWKLICLAGYNENFKESGNKTIPIIAAEVKFKPSQKFNLIFGAPVIIGLDWNMYRDLNFSGKLFITKEIEGHLSYFIKDILRFTVNYTSNQNRSSKTFFPSEILSVNDRQITFNNVTHYNNTILFEAGIKFQKNSVMNLGLGCKMKSDIDVYYDKNKILTMKSKENIFIKAGFSYLLYN